MTYQENYLNVRVADRIRTMTADLGWNVRVEVNNAFTTGQGTPDILIRRGDAPPVIIENEYEPARTLETDCLNRLGADVVSDTSGIGGEVSVVFALRSPDSLRQCEHAGEVDDLLQAGEQLEFAVYRGNREDYTRFPDSGFLRGDVRELVDFMRPASIPEDIVNQAADMLAAGTNDAADILIRHSDDSYDFGVKLGATLRQPWPLGDGKADAEARLQTARMCATMLINALAYQQNLSGHLDIDDLPTAARQRGVPIGKELVMDLWDEILDINYWPIFHIASQLLMDVPEDAASAALPGMHKTASRIQTAMRQNDVAGIVFQRLIADRKTLKTYYTRPESAAFLAHLAVPEDLDWSDPDVVKNYRIADYACGTGGLVLAAYQRVRDLHRLAGGHPDELHSHMMENSLTACDIMPASVHLSASLLSSVAPDRTYRGTRMVQYPFGGVRDADGELERDGKGRPVVRIGSLELLGLNESQRQVVMPLDGRRVAGATGEMKPVSIEMTPASQDLVIMNPPFTRPTKHAQIKPGGSVDPRNPAFAAFGTSEEEQMMMKAKERDAGKDTISDGNAGLGSAFAAIADNMVKPGGRIALILPLSSVVGGGTEGGVAYSWQKLRNMLSTNYTDIVVVSVTGTGRADYAFSADTGMGEVVVTARRLPTGAEPASVAHFVNLQALPGDGIGATQLAHAIVESMSNVSEAGTHADVKLGDDRVGVVSLETLEPNRKWTAVRLTDYRVYRRAVRLSAGELDLPLTNATVDIPITRLGTIGKSGVTHRRFAESFDMTTGCQPTDEHPFLWNRNHSTQFTMMLNPDKSGTPRAKRKADGIRYWTHASNLHIAESIGLDSNPCAAAYTPTPTGGGAAWPNMRMDTDDYERATCAWFGSTLGLMCYWVDANRTQGARSRTSVTAIPSIATLDLRRLTPNRLQAAVDIFNDLCHQRLLPASESYRDPVRHEIDRRFLVDVLGLGDDAVQQFAILRNQWCAETTVAGGKQTGIQNNT